MDTDWAYRAPRCTPDHPDQRYYRAQRWLHIAHGTDDKLDDRP